MAKRSERKIVKSSIPDQVVMIGGLKYVVQTVKDLKSDDGKVALHGWYRRDTFTILLDEEMEPARRRLVLMHEVMHGVLTHCGQARVMETDLAEVLCEAFAYLLLSATIDGKPLIS